MIVEKIIRQCWVSREEKGEGEYTRTRRQHEIRTAPSLTGFKKGALSYGTTIPEQRQCVNSINPFFRRGPCAKQQGEHYVRFPTRVDRVGCDAIAVGHTSGHRHVRTHTKKMIGFPSHSPTFIYDSLGLYFLIGIGSICYPGDGESVYVDI
jgi:hypothetical protein